MQRLASRRGLAAAAAALARSGAGVTGASAPRAADLRPPARGARPRALACAARRLASSPSSLSWAVSGGAAAPAEVGCRPGARLFATGAAARAADPAAPGATDARDPDIPPGLEDESLQSRKMQKTPNLDIPWLFDEPRLDYKAIRKTLPIYERNGVEPFQILPNWLTAPISWWMAQKTILLSFKRIAANQDGYLQNDFLPAVPNVLRQLLSALMERDEEALFRMCSPQLFERFQRAFADIDNAGAKVSVSISPVSDGVNANKDFDARIVELWMKMAPRWHFDPSIGIGRPCTSLRFSTCTILRDMIKEFDDDNDAGGSTPGVKFGVRPTVDDASGNPTGMGFAIRRQFRPELLHFRIDAAVLANVKSSVEIPPVGTDMAAPPVALASDKQRVEIVLSFMSQPIALRFGDLTDELNWRVADINYILSSGSQANLDSGSQADLGSGSQADLGSGSQADLGSGSQANPGQ